MMLYIILWVIFGLIAAFLYIKETLNEFNKITLSDVFAAIIFIAGGSVALIFYVLFFMEIPEIVIYKRKTK